MIAVLLLVLAPAAPVLLTVEDAVEKALNYDAHLRALGARRDEELAAGGWGTEVQNPELRLTSMQSDRLIAPLTGQGPRPSPLLGTSVAVRLPTPKLSTFSSEQERVRSRVARREAEADLARLALAHEVRALHAKTRALEGRVSLAAREVELSAQRVVLSERLLGEGLLTAIELEMAHLRTSERESALLLLQADRDQFQSQLLSRIGAETDDVLLVAPTSELCRHAPAPDLAAVSPEVRAWKARAKEADAEAWTGWLDIMPWPTFVQVRYEVGPTRGEDDLRLAVGFELPFTDLGQGEIRVARARSRRMQAEAEAERQRQVALRRSARVRAALATKALARSDADARRAIELRTKLMSAKGGAGLALPALLSLEEALLAQQVRRLQAEEACEMAAWELLRLGVRLDRGDDAVAARPQ